MVIRIARTVANAYAEEENPGSAVGSAQLYVAAGDSNVVTGLGRGFNRQKKNQDESPHPEGWGPHKCDMSDYYGVDNRLMLMSTELPVNWGSSDTSASWLSLTIPPKK
jgi:hypothetical protein